LLSKQGSSSHPPAGHRAPNSYSAQIDKGIRREPSRRRSLVTSAAALPALAVPAVYKPMSDEEWTEKYVTEH